MNENKPEDAGDFTITDLESLNANLGRMATIQRGLGSVVDQLLGVAKLVLSLDTGAIALTAVFLHDPPHIAGARSSVLFALIDFGLSFLLLLVAIIEFSFVQMHLQMNLVDVGLAALPEVAKSSRESLRQELLNSDEAFKRISKYGKGVKTTSGKKPLIVGTAFFVTGIAVLFYLAFRIVWNWP
jgi:hypothetical protein